ncbi:orotate phosphoribosyltransferase [Thermorudis peleae]|uniref:orotate phosphoribosyltransferase n=1 Tax=Thermorudis peleae TaxID=1382356 RepID=UPI00068E8582|nr:phosphoribosyltransferase family protein [Thermorudis peleae]MBX6754050.1 phosphoribosyltransferase [Thermorudis peleae]
MLFGAESNLDLAQALFDLGGVLFGEFDLGPTAGRSPVYINPRVLISEPSVLRRIAQLIYHEIQADQARRRPRLASFRAVAGVPMGGLHLATAFALVSDTPLIYIRPDTQEPVIEGRIIPGQTVLVIDDLMTGGTSLLRTAKTLEDAGLVVRDFIVLIDREQGGVERLREHGYHVLPILRLRTMLTYYYESGQLDSARYRTIMAYLEQTGRRPAALPPEEE